MPLLRLLVGVYMHTYTNERTIIFRVVTILLLVAICRFVLFSKSIPCHDSCAVVGRDWSLIQLLSHSMSCRKADRGVGVWSIVAICFRTMPFWYRRLAPLSPPAMFYGVEATPFRGMTIAMSNGTNAVSNGHTRNI